MASSNRVPRQVPIPSVPAAEDSRAWGWINTAVEPLRNWVQFVSTQFDLTGSDISALETRVMALEAEVAALKARLP